MLDRHGSDVHKDFVSGTYVLSCSCSHCTRIGLARATSAEELQKNVGPTRFREVRVVGDAAVVSKKTASIRFPIGCSASEEFSGQCRIAEDHSIGVAGRQADLQFASDLRGVRDRLFLRAAKRSRVAHLHHQVHTSE
jgi:hypothetical protein